MERADEKGVHVIYIKGYKTLRKELGSIADDDPHLGDSARDEIRAVIDRLERAEADRDHVAKHCDLIAGRLEHRREDLEFGSSWDKRAIPDRERYEAWRPGTDEAMAAAERVLANRREYGIHLDGMAHRGQSLASALSDVREVLREDDRHIAETLVGQRKGEDRQAREDRIAGLLDDPHKLRELRKQRVKHRTASERRERAATRAAD